MKSNEHTMNSAHFVARIMLAAVIGASLCSPVSGDLFNGVDFSSSQSFADEVIRFDPLFSGGPAPGFSQPQATLGVPDRIPFDAQSHQSLGRGGLIELLFTDNVLTNSGDGSADLYIGETQGTAEDFFLGIRPTRLSVDRIGTELDTNGDGFLELGRFAGEFVDGVYGYVSLINIDRFIPGFPSGSITFDAVQIIDDPNRGSSFGTTVGLDLESVGAISSVGPPTTGDFNGDGIVDAVDIDLISKAVLTGENDPQFDLDGDRGVDHVDRVQLINDVIGTYFGDSNLDGEFNSGDLVEVFRAGEYEDKVAMNSGWNEGDWNGDNEFDTSDLVTAFTAGGYERGPRAAIALPEPTSIVMLIGGLICIVAARRRKLGLGLATML